MSDPDNTKHQRATDCEQRGAVTDVIVQTAQDLKDVGLGVAASALYSQMRKPKDPPQGD